MGAFFLLRRTDAPGLDQRRETLLAELARQGFGAPQQFETAGCVVYLYGKLLTNYPNAAVIGPDDFCLSVGTFFYRGRIGREALARFHADFQASAISWDDIAGQFCLIVAKAGALHLVADRLGLFKVYRNADLSVVSSSLLAAAAVCPRRTVDAQSVYEYVFIGAPFGMRTVFDEVSLVDPDTIVRIDAQGIHATELPPVEHEPRAATRAELLELNSSTLRRYFGVLAEAFRDRISTALSGGYDSRLMLALLRSCGVSPYVYVYGAADGPDFRAARRMAEGEGFPLYHTDKLAGPTVAPDELGAIVELNFRLLDGCPYGGIFDDGTDLRTRCERAANGRLALNGMAGELFREPGLPNRPYRVLDVVSRFYCSFDPSVATDRFQGDAYCDALAQKIQAALRTTDELLSRADVIWLVPAFYARYWSGATVSVNNRLSPALLPFCDLTIVSESVRLPLAHILFGAFEAALIRAADPRLAAYPSSYGHGFDDPPPADRVAQEMRDILTPPPCFRFAKRPRAPRPYYLDAAHVEAVLDGSFPYMQRFFQIDRIIDAFQYNRICTLEYLFQRFSPSDPGKVPTIEKLTADYAD